MRYRFAILFTLLLLVAIPGNAMASENARLFMDGTEAYAKGGLAGGHPGF